MSGRRKRRTKTQRVKAWKALGRVYEKGCWWEPWRECFLMTFNLDDKRAPVVKKLRCRVSVA